MSPGLLVAVAGVFAVGLMLSLYLIQVMRRDAGIVDVGWAGGLGITALWYAVAADGEPAQRVFMSLVACLWSARLATYLIIDRIRHAQEDGRYRSLRERWGAKAPQYFLIFFLAQAVLIVLFSLPLLGAASQPPGSLAIWDFLGLLLGWGSILGESVADSQLRRWRGDPAHRGRTCRSGFWCYSRHPNYFFEWLHWWSYVLFTLGSGWIWAALLGPATMFLFLYRVTGIPYTERQALASRGEDYREYQRTTSAFIPWWPGEHD